MLSETNLELAAGGNEQAIKAAKTRAIIYNIISFALAVTMLFVKSRWGIAVLIVSPLFSALIIRSGNGSIKFYSDKKKSIYGEIYLGFIMPAIALLIMLPDDYTVLQTEQLWVPVIIVAVIVFGLFYIASIKELLLADKWQMGAIIICALVYGYIFTMTVNSAFDDSTSQIYTATVTDRREYHGKHASYYLTLSPWGPDHYINEQEVERALYDNTNIGSIVKVNLKQGFLHIPWFSVGKN